MSITYASQRNVASKEIPTSQAIPVVNTWVRPADWLTLPTVGPTDQKLVGLYAVYDNDANYIAVSATTSTGTYTVDWGDGSSPSTYTSGTVAQYTYNYASISSGTLSSRGYKQVIVTITPTTGNLTVIDLNQRYVPAAGYPTMQRYNSKWLDVSFGSPNLIDFNLPTSATVTANMLEQVTFVSKNASFIDFTDSFYLLLGLRKVNISADMSNVISTLSMFYNCSALEEVPYFDMTNNTNMQWMFQNCYNLRKVPTYNTSNVTNMSITFNNCRNLTEIPPLDFRKVNTLNTTFVNCVSLTKLPYMDTGNVVNMTQAFDGCTNLTTVPRMNMVNVTTTNNMFANCVSLVSTPIFNTSNATTMTSMFNGCQSLKTVGDIDTTKVTDVTNMFVNCKSLITAPSLNLSNTTSTVSMFSLCNGLTTTPEYNLANCTTANTMFNSCTALTTVGNINTPNLLTVSGMFASCNSLEAVPAFDTTKVTIMSTMFSGCSVLKSEGLPSFNTGNCTAMNGMFQNCTSLSSIPTFNTVKVTNFGAMFSSATALTIIPALNMANSTASATFAATAQSMGNCLATGAKTAIDFSNCLMGKTNLEDLFTTKLGTPASAQTLAITNNPGADTVVSKTATWTTSSKNVTITVAGSVTANMYMYGTAITAITCSFAAGTDLVTVTGGSATAPIAGTLVAFSTSVGSVAINTLYYVINPSGATFQLSTTPGGSVFDITVSGSGTMRYALKVTNVVGTTVTLDNFPMAAGTGVATTFRLLNTNLATFRLWTVSG